MTPISGGVTFGKDPETCMSYSYLIKVHLEF